MISSVCGVFGTEWIMMHSLLVHLSRDREKKLNPMHTFIATIIVLPLFNNLNGRFLMQGKINQSNLPPIFD